MNDEMAKWEEERDVQDKARKKLASEKNKATYLIIYMKIKHLYMLQKALHKYAQ